MKLAEININEDSFPEIVDKINSMIKLLNDSFITQDPDTSIEITCDRLQPLPNEHTTITSTIHYDNNIIDRQTNPLTNKVCPSCGKSYYTPLESYTTAMYCPPIYKDGKNINESHNTSTHKYQCLSCRFKMKLHHDIILTFQMTL